MTTRDYEAERYNRRTRALERQAAALEAIGDALREQAAAARVQAIAAAASTSAPTTTGNRRAWRVGIAQGFMTRLADRVREL